MVSKKTKLNFLTMSLVVSFCFTYFSTSILAHAEGESCDISGVGSKDEKVSQSGQITNPEPVKKAQRKTKPLPTASPSVAAPQARPLLSLTKGSDHATVTIIAYTDFPCVPCAKTNIVLNQVMAAYPDEIQIVYKHYPSPLRLNAVMGHEAVLVAAAQGQFQEMQSRLSSHKGEMTEAVLVDYAKDLKLDVGLFSQALESHRYRNKVLNDLEEAKGFGVTNAPTFFINGKKLVGARSVQDFKQIIDVALGLTPPPLIAQARPNLPSQLPRVVKVNTQGAFVKGPLDAPIEIVEFSDFQCPFCNRVLPTLEKVMLKYPGKVRWVFKHFPLPFHADAPLAHEAALAAGEQGKFWEMHDRIFLQQKTMKREHLIKHAKTLGLDLEKVTADMDSGRFKTIIQQDLQEGRQLGVSGTPAFFVNGQRLSGARPVSDFISIIEKELGSGSPSMTAAAFVLSPPSDLSALGSDKALVQVEAFIDLSSPLSAKTLNLLRAIQPLYADEVRISIRHFPQSFHVNAPLLHQAALAAGVQGQYWEMQTLILGKRSTQKKPQLMAYARQLKLDESAFALALEEKAFEKVLKQDRAAGLQNDIRGVPTLLLNGKKIDGIPDILTFRKLINAAIKKNGF